MYDGIVNTNNGGAFIFDSMISNMNIINSYGIFDFIITHGTCLNFLKRDYNIINRNYGNLHAIGNMMDALEPNGMLILHNSWDISIDAIIGTHNSNNTGISTVPITDKELNEFMETHDCMMTMRTTCIRRDYNYQ